MYKKGWYRDLKVRWTSLFEHRGSLLVTERESRLVKIDPLTGKVIWDTSLWNAYGWLTASDDRVYYLEQTGVLKVIDFDNGQHIKSHQFDDSHMGYILVCGKYLVSGSWRGYTDLVCLDLNDFSIVWKLNTKSKQLKSYSLPVFSNGSVIFSDNTNHTIKSIDLETGAENWQTALPNNIKGVELGYTFQVFSDKIFVYSTCGKVYSFDDKNIGWTLEIEHFLGIQTLEPKVLNHQYIFQDIEGYICSYDRQTQKLRWRFYSNHANGLIPALEIDNELTLLCLNMRKKLIIDKDGEIVHSFSSERRLGSDLIEIDKDVFYLTKSELKQLKHIC